MQPWGKWSKDLDLKTVAIYYFDKHTFSFFWKIQLAFPAFVKVGYGVHMQNTTTILEKPDHNHNIHVNVLMIWHRSLYISSQVWPRLLVWDSKAN